MEQESRMAEGYGGWKERWIVKDGEKQWWNRESNELGGEKRRIPKYFPGVAGCTGVGVPERGVSRWRCVVAGLCAAGVMDGPAALLVAWVGFMTLSEAFDSVGIALDGGDLSGSHNFTS
ncbi:hypothetical protein O3P69_011502 [Scylla paramamosain]|uniref:Uncharacterized protein n=1 Tax=Scylla paramamosain TaxID=85552 RepID=A0AAW0T7V3_SCYPA